MWSALRLVCEMLRSGDLSGAQALLDAVGATCPSGRVAFDRRSGGRKGGVFDALGVLYEIPGWVVGDPEDLIEEEKEVVDDEEDEEAVPRREEKGKGRAEEVGEIIRVRARLSDRGTDVLISVGKEQKVAVLVRTVQEEAGVSGKVKLAYMGKMLDEGKTLAQNGWREGHVVNALVFG